MSGGRFLDDAVVNVVGAAEENPVAFFLILAGILGGLSLAAKLEKEGVIPSPGGGEPDPQGPGGG